jgi:hypothetical protein
LATAVTAAIVEASWIEVDDQAGFADGRQRRRREIRQPTTVAERASDETLRRFVRQGG